ncbi:MAG: hypothetical protein KTR26_09770 [Flammeovirgaceae bacterium]|nr:hypothetical protein [Flammeovirgaceae bacterium]
MILFNSSPIDHFLGNCFDIEEIEINFDFENESEKEKAETDIFQVEKAQISKSLTNLSILESQLEKIYHFQYSLKEVTHEEVPTPPPEQIV